jgi:O-antigen ligase
MENRFQGFWGHPNSIGVLSMVSYPVLLWKFEQSTGYKKWMICGLIAMCALMHFLSGSRGSITASAIGIALWFIMANKKLNLIFFLVLAILIFGLVIKFKPSAFLRDETFNLTNLTGRTEFWTGAYTLIKERALFGYGYDVEGKIWNDIRFYNPDIDLWRGSVMASLHNGYLSVLIGVGLIGFATWCFVLFLPLWRCCFSPANPSKTVAVSIMVMCLVLNFIETIITGCGALSAIFFWIAWVMAISLARSAKSMSHTETV